MRVLFLHRQPCIRAMKYALGLEGRDEDVTLGFAYQGRTLSEWYGSGDELFDGWWRLPRSDPGDAIARAVEEFRPDLIHSHNLPDLLTVLALRAVGGDVPVVHDVHDMQSLRRTPYEDGFDDPEDPLDLERAAVEGCDGLIAVSIQMLAELEARYDVGGPVLLFANYALERDLSPDAGARGPAAGPPRVVYQGSLSANGSHYDLRGHFASIARSGVPIDVFPNRDAPAYRELAERTAGMRVMDTLEPSALLRRLPAYDLGWAGFNSGLNAAHLDTALPNKAFEYLASGLPVAAGPHGALRRLVEDEGVGFVVPDPADLGAMLARVDLDALRARVADRRHRFTVEGHIGDLLAFYRDLIAGPRGGTGPAPARLHSGG
ncbi:MAG TPA: glycosyltransferase [Miltoncostaeaceae bacterium]|nr:glycosyltransferase [Miltoncostaeaceae bacterium]